MRVVAPGLTVAVHRGIPRVIRGLAGTGIAALNTLQARPRLQLRAVHGDVLVRQQPRRPGLGGHRVEERRRDVAGQQSVPILRERRGMPYRVVHVPADEPANQEVVVEFLHQQSFAPDRVEHLQHQRAQQLFGRDRRTPRRGRPPGEAPRHRPQRLVCQRPHRTKGVIRRHSLFRRHITNHVAGLLILSAHDVAPFGCGGSIVVRPDRSVDPPVMSFSAAC